MAGCSILFLKVIRLNLHEIAFGGGRRKGHIGELGHSGGIRAYSLIPPEAGVAQKTRRGQGSNLPHIPCKNCSHPFLAWCLWSVLLTAASLLWAHVQPNYPSGWPRQPGSCTRPWQRALQDLGQGKREDAARKRNFFFLDIQIGSANIWGYKDALLASSAAYREIAEVFISWHPGGWTLWQRTRKKLRYLILCFASVFSGKTCHLISQFPEPTQRTWECSITLLQGKKEVSIA